MKLDFVILIIILSVTYALLINAIQNMIYCLGAPMKIKKLITTNDRVLSVIVIFLVKLKGKRNWAHWYVKI